MKGFVLAAGFGQRLAPITHEVPKPLMPVGNVPLIGYALKLLAHHGITDVIVNLHHLCKSVKEQLGSGERYGVQITYSIEEDILGTGGGLKKMHAALQEETFVVVNSDILIDVDLRRVLESHRARGALATMVLRQDPSQDEYGAIEIDDTGRVRRILGSGDAAASLRPAMFTGVHVLEPRFLEYLPPDVKTCVVRYGYSKALANGDKINGYLSEGYWADAGTVERYLAANCDALDQSIKLAHMDPLEGYALSPRRDVAEVVRMGDGVELGTDVRLLPPVVLGDGVRVGDNATIGPYAVVGDRVQIGRDASVSRSVALAGARIEAGALRTRCILAKKSKLGTAESH